MSKLPKKIDIKVICLHDLPNFDLQKDKRYKVKVKLRYNLSKCTEKNIYFGPT